MRRAPLGYPLLVLVLVGVVIAGAAGYMPSPVVAAAVYGIPGFLVAELLIGRRDVGRVERGLFAATLSVVLIILGAQVLNLVPSGVSGFSWIVLLGAVSAVAAAGLVRARRASQPRPGFRMRSVERADALQLVAGAALVVLAGVVAVVAASVRTDPGFTQLSIERLSDTVNITVESDELAPTRYRLVVSTEPGEHVLDLAPGETFSLPIQAPDGAQRIEVELYRGEEQEPYREVSLEL